MKSKFWIDVVILVLFLVGFEPALTGGKVHEWLNLAFAGVMLVHLLMNWTWIVSTLHRTVSAVPRGLRVNQVVDALLFVVFVIMVMSGLMISRHVLADGVSAPPPDSWNRLHHFFSDVLLALLGLHFAVHWRWVSETCARYLISPLRALFGPRLAEERRPS